jgi:hypothetical protein
MNLETARKLFEEHGYTMTATEYKNARTHLSYICPKHPDKELKITYDKLKSGRGCRFCSAEGKKEKYKLPFSEVEAAFSSRGYQLLDKDYVNNSTYLNYVCSKHPEEVQKIVYNSLKQGHGCRFCGYTLNVEARRKDGFISLKKAQEASLKPESLAKRSGENHPNWNPDLTYEGRLHHRYTLPEYREWVDKVFAQDNYTCQKCDSRGVHLNAHHKDGWHWCEERRFDVDNGATLCVDCHNDFHRQYGYGNNTEQQYKEWVK